MRRVTRWCGQFTSLDLGLIHVSRDVPAIGAEWFTGNLHKWAFAPKGSAFLWVHPAEHASAQAPIISHEYQSPFQDRFIMQARQLREIFFFPRRREGGGALSCGVLGAVPPAPAALPLLICFRHSPPCPVPLIPWCPSSALHQGGHAKMSRGMSRLRPSVICSPGLAM